MAVRKEAKRRRWTPSCYFLKLLSNGSFLTATFTYP
jgi:hypothetical protein